MVAEGWCAMTAAATPPGPGLVDLPTVVAAAAWLVIVIQLAANLTNPHESDIEPSNELLLGGKKLAPPKPGKASRPQSLWTYLVLMVLALLLVEWFTFNRRITV